MQQNAKDAVGLGDRIFLHINVELLTAQTEESPKRTRRDTPIDGIDRLAFLLIEPQKAANDSEIGTGFTSANSELIASI